MGFEAVGSIPEAASGCQIALSLVLESQRGWVGMVLEDSPYPIYQAVSSDQHG